MFIKLSPPMIHILAHRYAERCSVEDFHYGRVRGHQWEFPGTERYQQTVEGVVLAYRIARTWWNGKPTHPWCMSSDGSVGLHERHCLGCPQNQFGTRGRGKACTEYRMIFLLEEDHDEPTLLVVPPTSLNSVRQYVQYFPDHAALFQLVSVFTIVPTEGKIGRVVGTMQRPLREDELHVVQLWRNQLLPLLEYFTPVDGKKLFISSST